MASTPSASSRALSLSKGWGYRAKSSCGPNCRGLTKMLAITRRFSRRARFTRLSWPGCRAPIVGTRPMSSPAWRQAIAWSCIAIADSMTIVGLADGVLVLRGGVGAGLDILVELARGGLDRLSQFRVLPHELRHVPGVQPQDVLDDEHLGVAAGTGAYADGRNRQRLRHALAERTWNALEDDGKGACLLQRLRITDDAFRGLVAATLNPHATELIDKRRSQTEVRHHRNPHRRQDRRVSDDSAPSLHLHGLNPRFLNEAAGISDGVLFRGVVGHEWHVADDQCIGSAANHGSGVPDHVVHRHAQGVRITQHGRP